MNKKRILTAAGITAIFVAVIFIVSVIVRRDDKPADISGDSDFVVEATTDRYTEGDITTVYDTEGERTDKETENTSDVTETDSIISNTETESEHMTFSETATIENTVGKETEFDSSDKTSAPETSVSGTSAPGTSAPESSKAETSASGTTAQETSVPGTSSETVEKDTTQTASSTENSPDSEDSKEQHSYAEFTFIKYNIQNMPADYNWSAYLERQGYLPVDNISEFNKYATELVNNLPNTKSIKYIITPRNELDTLCENESVSDSILYDTLGLDYQTYLCKGIAVFKFKKIQDVVNNVTDKSVYALYYYSYLDGEQMKAVDDRIEEIVSGFSGSDFDKIKAAHDELRACVTYDDSPETDILSHTAYGALIKGKSVCEGYAKAYKLMLDAMNIKCNYVTSSVHAWNEVEYDGKWYMVDVTNDDTNNGYCYFMLGCDVLLSKKNVHIDGFVLDEEEKGQISQFGYADGKNFSTVTLSGTTYDYKNRIKVYENPQ